MPIKLLIATPLYPPDIGGPATYTKMLETHLPSHGFSVRVVQYSLVRRYPKIVRHLVFAWKLYQESKWCDVIYALDPVSVGVPTCLIHRLTKKPFYIRIPGDYAWEQGCQRFGVTDTLDTFIEHTKRYALPVRILKRVQSWVTRQATSVIVPSDYMQRIVVSWGVPETRITRIYSALHPVNVAESREEIRTMFQYEGIVLLTAGRLVPWKGIETLISLMPRIIETLGSATLVVVGTGPLESALKEQVASLGVTEHVRFAGRVPKDALGAAIAGADVFVLNTAYEGFSHQLLEVMDLGVPIVTTDVGGNPELITDGVSGLLVPYDDEDALVNAIDRAATHEELRTHIVQHAHLRAKDFEEARVVGVLAAHLDVCCDSDADVVEDV